jgi:hypothetical protein
MLPKDQERKYLGQDIAYYAIPSLNKLLKSTALSAGWPKNLVDNLTVAFDGKALYVNYPEQYAQQVEDLEYGAVGSLPNPAIRPFINRSDSVLKTVFQGKIFDDLVTMEGVFQ